MKVFFTFYLDAWNFCRHNNIEFNKISRQNSAKWMVVFK